jgi:hypothetical protein
MLSNKPPEATTPVLSVSILAGDGLSRSRWSILFGATAHDTKNPRIVLELDMTGQRLSCACPDTRSNGPRFDLRWYEAMTNVGLNSRGRPR